MMLGYVDDISDGFLNIKVFTHSVVHYWIFFLINEENILF